MKAAQQGGADDFSSHDFTTGIYFLFIFPLPLPEMPEDDASFLILFWDIYVEGLENQNFWYDAIAAENSLNIALFFFFPNLLLLHHISKFTIFQLLYDSIVTLSND